MTQILDHGYIKLVETWGSDQAIIEAARMSTDGSFKGWGPIHTGECLQRQRHDEGCSCDPKPGDEKLLKYLWTNKHHTPFEMAGLKIEVQAPIFVFREWHRHRTQSYNEMSGRYVQLPNLYYIPSIARLIDSAKISSNKQASGIGEILTQSTAHIMQRMIRSSHKEARQYYENLLLKGISKEVARVVIPVAQYSRMTAQANLRNWLQFLTLRMDSHAQWEIRQYANAVGDLVKEHFPRTWELFDETRGP